MSNICRTCIQAVEEDEFFSLTGSVFASNNMQVKDVLATCIPELDLELAPNAVMCKNCILTLNIAYQFRQQTLRNESILRNSESESYFNNVYVKFDTATNTIVTKYEADENKLTEENTETFREEELELIKVDEEIYEDKSTEEITEQVPETNPEHINDDAEEQIILQEPSEFQGDPLNVNSVIQYLPGFKKVPRVERPFKCSSCDFGSTTKANLEMHERIHTGETPFACSFCSYKAKRKEHLDNHVMQHTGERPYECLYCAKTFITKQTLKRHMYVHTGEKPYRCLQCNFRSRHRISIVNHVKHKHLGISRLYAGKPLICDICGKTLSGTNSYKAHLRLHLQIKSHLCELCGKYFREKSMLLNHLRTHTGEKPYSCGQCDYASSRNGHLKDHVKLHDKYKTLYACPLCNKRYVSKRLVKKHMKEEHPENDIEQDVQPTVLIDHAYVNKLEDSEEGLNL